MAGRIDLAAEEARYHNELQDRRLISEVRWRKTEVDDLKAALLENHDGPWKYPSVAAVVTVGLGVFSYRSGDFWDVAFPGFEQPRRQRWGMEFEAFIGRHPSLEKFDFLKVEHAHRFVAPILAHGGVPCSCLDELFSLITSRCGPDQTGSEVLQELEGQGSTRPVQRFIRFGGEVAEDLIGRLLVVWDVRDRGGEGANAGLPDHIAEAFDEWYRRERPSRDPRRRRFPGPAIHLDPALMTITLHLPRCDEHLGRRATWRALDRAYPTDRDSTVLLTRPETRWDVQAGSRPAFSFGGCSDASPCMLFDPASGSLIREPEKRRLPPQVWALYRSGLQANPAPVHEEPFLPWTDYSLAVFALEGCERLEAGGQAYEVRRAFFEFDEEDGLVAGSQGEPSRIPVRRSPPKISWVGGATLELAVGGADQGIIPVTSNELPVLLEEPGEYRLHLTGPVGQNLKLSYLHVPELAIDPSPRVKLPGTGVVRWDVSAPGATVSHEGQPGASFSTALPKIDLAVSWPGRKDPLQVVCSVPSVEWCVCLDPEAHESFWTTEARLVSVSDLNRGQAPILLARLPGAGADGEVTLESVSGHRIAARLVHGSQESLWRFDLRHARDEALRTGAARRYELVVQSAALPFRGPALEVRPAWDIDRLAACWRCQDSEDTMRITWAEQGAPLVGRWIEVLPVWRPWDRCTLRRELGTGESGQLELSWPEHELRPGRYIVQAIHAPWGLDDLASIKRQQECFVNVHPAAWRQVFELDQPAATVREYLEALLAHWCNRERVRRPPQAPRSLKPVDVLWFLDHYRHCDALEPRIPRDGSRALTIFLVNPEATAQAIATWETLPLEWEPILPSPPVLSIDLSHSDAAFLVDLVLNNLRGLAETHRRASLSPPLQEWHRDLRHRPPRADDVIFLAERYRVFEHRCGETQAIYEELKSKYMGREAV